MTDDEITELMVHPRVRASIERILHAKLVALGLCKTGYQLAVARSEQRGNRTEKRMSLAHQALDNNWLRCSDVADSLGLSVRDVKYLRDTGKLELVAHGYVSQESVDQVRAGIADGSLVLPSNKEKMPKPAKAKVQKAEKRKRVVDESAPPDVGLVTYKEAAARLTLTDARISQLVHQHQLSTWSLKNGEGRVVTHFHLPTLQQILHAKRSATDNGGET